ncbi:MAG: 3-deoxy-D-manno-octulosonate 8-phosphate phosphatase [Lachnospiraceae bacterium]|nr:3-deoxy-D-manno-octulosonate 8-phosphate phosphatase [Lachnospiraceae bacterium]MCM1238771.1 3-deoxy-D-manno-octulosonate 8-phosphate phosphatase [Lachnospiraceae bacterium]
MISFLVMDVDGTLTDGKIYMGEDGEIFKAFSIKDGYGIKELLPENDIVPIIITARNSKILVNRCEELGIKEIHQGVRKKIERLNEIILGYCSDVKQYSLKNVAYIGDDVIDLPCMEQVKEAGGIVGCPADAAREVVSIADYVSDRNGGEGAVRDFIEWLAEDRSKRK